MTNIDEANVSEAAKAFYREYLVGIHTPYGGWSEEDYRIIRELNLAGLITVSLHRADISDNEESGPSPPPADPPFDTETVANEIMAIYAKHRATKSDIDNVLLWIEECQKNEIAFRD